MGVVSAWVLALALWSLLNFWWLPLTRQRWKTADLRSKLARAGTLSVLEKVRDLSAIALVTLSLVILMVWLCQGLASVSFSAPKVVLQTLSSTYGLITDIDEIFGRGLEILGIIGASIALLVVARRARATVSRAWLGKANEVYARLRANPAELSALSEDLKLRPAVEHLTRLAAVFAEKDRGERTMSTPEVEAANREIERALQFIAIELARKELKLEDALRDPRATLDKRPATWRSRLGGVLFSDRLCKDLGLVRKPVSYVASALLFIALIGWSSAPLANNLRLTVNNLRVNIERSAAQRELDTALSQTPGPVQESAPAQIDSAAVRSVTQLIVRATARQLVRSAVLSIGTDLQRSRLSEGEYVRAQLADHALDSTDPSDTVVRLRQDVSQAVGRDPGRIEPIASLQGRLEKDIRVQVAALAHTNPGVFERVRNALEARYSASAAPIDAEGRLIESVLDNALESVDVEPATELGKEAQRLVKEFGRTAVKTWVDSVSQHFVAELVFGAARGDVQTIAETQFRFESSNQTRRFVETLRASAGTNWVYKGAEDDREATQKVASAIAQRVARDHDEQLALAARLGGYDGLFPLSDPPGSAAPDLSSGGGGGGGGGPISPGGAGPNANSEGRAAAAATREAESGAAREISGLSQAASRAAATFVESRASSFILSSRSFRVRGVLIGRDQRVERLAVDDIRWRLAPAPLESTKVAIEVHRDGGWIPLGTFDAGVVNQAIRYAADRRVVATTITPGDGDVVQRLTDLHPVLAGTPLGCRIVEVDRLVDTFSIPHDQKNAPAQIKQLASDREAMWRWLQVMSLTERVAQVPRSESCPVDEIAKAIEHARIRTPVFSDDLFSALDQFLTAREQQLQGSTRVIRAELSCQSKEGRELASCLCERRGAGESPVAYWMPEDHTSQFREREVMLRPDMSWMTKSTDHMAHIDLWVHTTFALHRPASPSQPPEVDEASAIALDFPRGELESLREVVLAQLPAYVARQLRGPSYDEFLAPVEDFVLVQRFMRAALAGELSPAFPMTKLLKLESDTKRYVPTQPTIKWEPATSEQDFRELLARADSRALNTYVSWRQDVDKRAITHKAVCDRVSN